MKDFPLRCDSSSVGDGRWFLGKDVSFFSFASTFSGWFCGCSVCKAKLLNGRTRMLYASTIVSVVSAGTIRAPGSEVSIVVGSRRMVTLAGKGCEGHRYLNWK